MYYLNANNIYFNLKEKKSQAKAILNKNGKKERQNILHANSVKYLQSFCFFVCKCTLYMQLRKVKLKKSNVFISDTDTNQAVECLYNFLYTSEYIIIRWTQYNDIFIFVVFYQ